MNVGNVCLGHPHVWSRQGHVLPGHIVDAPYLPKEHHTREFRSIPPIHMLFVGS